VIHTPQEALALVRARVAVPLTPAGSRLSLVEAATGERPKGSWWGHPKGTTIYALATALEDSPEVAVLKLVRGKITFLHRAAWPALLRVALDATSRRAAAAELPAAARRLLERVEDAGEVRLDALARTSAARRALKAAAHELESRLLVMSRSVHTERGRHDTLLQSWRRWAPADVVAEARQLDLGEARRRIDDLRDAAGDVAGVGPPAPER